jgi:hypothetical protein
MIRDKPTIFEGWAVSARLSKAWNKDEFERYLVLAWRDELITRSGYKELGDGQPSYEIEPEIVRLTLKGWRFLEEHDKSIARRWFSQIIENVPTIVASVVAFILGRALLQALGIVE